MQLRNAPRLCFIGFGEAGQAFASGLRESGIETISAWDILFPQPDGEPLRRAGEKVGVRLANSAADAVRGAHVVVSAVTDSSLTIIAILAPVTGALSSNRSRYIVSRRPSKTPTSS